MRKLILVFIALILFGCSRSDKSSESVLDEENIIDTARQIALQFDYYDEISAEIPNFHKGDSETEGQCGDYALAFVNLWNSKNDTKAMLVIQQQGIKQFPDGIYEVLGKDKQDLPFLKDRSTSMLYIWNNVYGLAHPELGGYKIKLKKKVHVDSHFGFKNWENNGPHVWVIIDDISVDPTYADFGTLPIIGTDTFESR